ncbi:MAG: class I mannose-6-phosphate isomerase [Lachnospiraceae bacterium]|nr:class I mannose-6-phosphate isomerase [Lachnospiraceae bacterium]
MGTLPFLLKPAYKDYLWGGDRLKSEYNKDTDISPLAESWECSVNKDGESIVASGVFEGKTLKEVLQEHPEFIGTHPDKELGFPLLIKLIDAKEDLSIQVHPDDEYAREHENGEYGKYEMWYVLEAEKDAQIVYGFSHDCTKEQLRRAIENGTITRHLQKAKVKKGDIFFVPPGTVHAIGKGIVIAEIQESSDLTYRLYDYNRIDKNGCKRKLHIEKALDVLNLQESLKPKRPLRLLKYKNECANEFIARCRYFEVHRCLVNNEYKFKADEYSFRVLLCVDGKGKISYEQDELIITKGDCVFIPADSCEITLSGSAEFLDIHA